MATDVVEVSGWQRLVAFVRDSYNEIRHKTTWPDFPQVRQASIAIIVFVLLLGLFIAVMDLVLRGVLINLIPSLFR